MKKLFGLLVAGSLCMFAACSGSDDDNSITPPEGSTNDQCSAHPGYIPNPDPATSSFMACIPASSADMGSSSSSDAASIGGDQGGQSSSSQEQGSGLSPVAASSSSIAPTTPSSSSAAPVAQSSSVKSDPTPASSTPPANEDDGLFKLALWDGTAGDVQVPTGNKDGGWWYSYADDLGSAITWKTELGPENNMAPVIEACGGVCGDFVIGEGDTEAGVYPYLGFAFGYGKTNATGDATSSKGICVTYSYSGTATFAIELGLTQSQENKLQNALPMVTLPAGSNKTIDYNWSDFEQPEWATTTMTGANAAKVLSSIKFKFADVTGGESGSFTIFKVGAPGQCD